MRENLAVESEEWNTLSGSVGRPHSTGRWSLSVGGDENSLAPLRRNKCRARTLVGTVMLGEVSPHLFL